MLSTYHYFHYYCIHADNILEDRPEIKTTVACLETALKVKKIIESETNESLCNECHDIVNGFER